MVKQGDRVKIKILRQSIGEEFIPGSVLSLVVDFVNIQGFITREEDVEYVAPYSSHKIFWELVKAPLQMENK